MHKKMIRGLFMAALCALILLLSACDFTCPWGDGSSVSEESCSQDLSEPESEPECKPAPESECEPEERRECKPAHEPECKPPKDPCGENDASLRIPILLYHDIVCKAPDCNSSGGQYINTAESLEENIRYLKEEGFTFITFCDLHDAALYGEPLPKKPILLTFDDGTWGQYAYAWPVLKKHEVPAAFFIVTDWVGCDVDGVRRFDWAEAYEMKQSGLISFYSHGKSHRRLNEFPPDKAVSEVEESLCVLENNLGSECPRMFAYPYGAFSPELVSRLADAGVEMQLYGTGINRRDSLDLHHLLRLEIPCGVTGAEIEEEIYRYR